MDCMSAGETVAGGKRMVQRGSQLQIGQGPQRALEGRGVESMHLISPRVQSMSRSARPTRSGDNTNLGAQKFRSQVRPIRPNQRTEFRMETEWSKLLHIAQGLKHWAGQIGRQVYYPFDAIAESDPNSEIGEVTGFHDSR